MNIGVLARFFGMFVAVIVVWGSLRSRSAPRWLLGLAIASGPVAYSVSAFLGAAQFFPAGQAAYYAVNPMFVAAVAGQCAMAGVGEAVWRWWSRRRGRSAPALTWQIGAVVVVGLLVVFVTVLWQGGVPYFFWYQRGYLLPLHLTAKRLRGPYAVTADSSAGRGSSGQANTAGVPPVCRNVTGPAGIRSSAVTMAAKALDV